jgi:hypothetical protein
MPGRGFLLALDDGDVESLRACATAEARERWITAWLDGFDAARLGEVDRAWPSIHRCLADGGDAGSEELVRALPNGPDPARAGIASHALVPRELVPAVARALGDLDEDAFRSRFYRTLPPVAQDDSDELDFLYTWQWFLRVRALYARAAADGRAVLFTARPPGDAGLRSCWSWSLAGAEGSDPRRLLA